MCWRRIISALICLRKTRIISLDIECRIWGWQFFFSFQYFIGVVPLSSSSIISDKKSVIILVVPQSMCLFYLLRQFLYLIFISLSMMYLSVIFFLFILFGVCWAFRNWVYIFHQFWRLPDHYLFKYFFFPSLSPSSLTQLYVFLTFWYCPRSLRHCLFLLFFLWFLVWISVLTYISIHRYFLLLYRIAIWAVGWIFYFWYVFLISNIFVWFFSILFIFLLKYLIYS